MVTVQKRADGRWIKPCPECGEMQDYLRKNYAEQSLNLNKTCKKCSNRKTENNHRGMYNLIRLSWFEKTKKGAELRGLVFDLSLEDVWFLYTAQEGRCALSGMSIGWAEVGSIHSASIDRIDSSKGYIKGNVQLLHKDVNFMKQQFSQEYFVEVCKAIADKEKW
jgi:hypothetical protein